jgi:uncharacterized membrane protein
MSSRAASKLLHRLFRISLIVKAADGAFEIAGGVLLGLIKPVTLSRLASLLTQRELSEDPKDFAATHLRMLVEHLGSDVRTFAVAYLLVHGIVKVVLALNLWRENPRVYPWALGFFGLFMAYELYRVSYTRSPALAGFFSLDLLLVALIQWEHGRKRRAA